MVIVTFLACWAVFAGVGWALDRALETDDHFFAAMFGGAGFLAGALAAAIVATAPQG